MQEGCDIIDLFMLLCQERLLSRKVVKLLTFYDMVSGEALKQKGCDIIHLL